MSDNETAGPSLGEDIDLPKATVAKLINEYLPVGLTCAKDARDLVGDACKEFITLVSSEAQDICEKSQKKTMMPEQIVQALKTLGFEKYVAEVESATDEVKTKAKTDKVKKANRNKPTGMTEEELLAEQEKMFAASRARMDMEQPPQPQE